MSSPAGSPAGSRTSRAPLPAFCPRRCRRPAAPAVLPRLVEAASPLARLAPPDSPVRFSLGPGQVSVPRQAPRALQKARAMLPPRPWEHRVELPLRRQTAADRLRQSLVSFQPYFLNTSKLGYIANGSSTIFALCPFKSIYGPASAASRRT